MPKKYAKMMIEIPIEIYENGDYKIHEDRSVLSMEPCLELPPINTNAHDSVLEVLTNILLPNTQEKIRWGNRYSDEEEEEEEDDEEEEEEKDEEEDHVVIQEPELRIYLDEIKPKKNRKENNIMTFKKRYHFKDNHTRKLRFHPENLQLILKKV